MASGLGKWSIPTAYSGVRFRSKLEANWARFFDQHRIKWAYEPQGFKFANGICYLPDFWLPDLKTIVEVKGIMDETDEAKLRALWEAAGRGGPYDADQVLILLAESEIGTVKLVDFGVQHWDEVGMLHCAECAGWYFAVGWDTWMCRACGFYDGHATFDAVHPGHKGTWFGSGNACADCGTKPPSIR